MTISGLGLIVVATQEDFKPVPYKDSGGIYTDGFGNTRNVIPNRKVSVLSGLVTLSQNTKEAEKAINQCVIVGMYQHEFDALVDAAFNLGGKKVCDSSMVKELNAGNYKASCEAYLLYDKIRVNGQLVSCKDAKYNCRGIVARREKERAVCLGQY
jgi:GH24 family phage-related lysozyme (muramidase)